MTDEAANPQAATPAQPATEAQAKAALDAAKAIIDSAHERLQKATRALEVEKELSGKRKAEAEKHAADADCQRRAAESHAREVESLKRSGKDLADDRERWKARAVRAEKAAAERTPQREVDLIHERDRLRSEVAKKDRELATAKTLEATLRNEAQEARTRAQAAEQRFSGLETTAATMQQERDRAVGVRDKAVAIIQEAMKELAAAKIPTPERGFENHPSVGALASAIQSLAQERDNGLVQVKLLLQKLEAAKPKGPATGQRPAAPHPRMVVR